MSHQTIRLALWKHGYHGRNPRKRPFVSGQNPQKRLQFSREYVDREEHFWDKVIWSDETQVKLFDSKRVQTVWRKKNSADKHMNTVRTIKHGGAQLRFGGAWLLMVLGQFILLMVSWRKLPI